MALKEIFGKFGRKSKKDSEDKQEDRIDDFAVLENKELADPIDEYSTDSGIVDDETDDDFDELDYLDQLDHQEAFQDTEYDENEYEYDFGTPETEGDVYENDDIFDDEENTNSTDDLEDIWNESSYDDWEQNKNEAKENSVSEQSQQAKHVTIVPLHEYQDLSSLNDIIERNKEMVSNEGLIKRLDIFDNDGEELSKLDKIKKDYITSKIYSSEIQNLTQNYVDNIDVLIENTKLNLAEAHNGVLTIDYEDRALDFLESDLDDIESEYEEDISTNESKEEEAYQNRLNNFMEKQASELEAFKREQEQRLLDYKEEQYTKKQSNIEMYTSERTDRYEKAREKILAEETYKQEQKEANRLNPLKRDMLNAFESELKEASKDMKAQLKEHLNEIRKEVEQKEHQWKTEIHQEEMRKEEKRKQDIEEEKLRLEKEAFELERQERLERLKMKREQQDYYRRMDEQTQRDNDLLRNELNEANLSQSELTKALITQVLNQNKNEGSQESFLNKTPMNESKTVTETKNNNSIFQRYIIGGIGILLIVLLTVLTLTLFQNRSYIAPGDSDLPAKEDINISQAETNDLEQLTEELSLLREQLATEEVDEDVTEEVEPSSNTDEDSEALNTSKRNGESSDEKKSLDSFLVAGDFEKAIEVASTEKEFDQIANAMRKQEALVELVNFNQRFDTPYGKLDEYVLRDRIWKVFNELMNLPESHLLNMPNERRNDVVLYMYQNDFISYGNWLLENRKEEN